VPRDVHDLSLLWDVNNYKKAVGLLEAPGGPTVWPAPPLEFPMDPEAVPSFSRKRWNFEHIKVAGFIEHKQNHGDDPSQFHLNQLYSYYPSDPCPDPKWAVVMPTYENLMAASKKFDNPQTFDFYNDPDVVEALSIIEEYVEPYWRQKPMNWKDVWSEFEMDTASGFPFGAYGLKKKGDVFRFPEAFMEYMLWSVYSGSRVFFKSSPKREFLSLVDIDAEKIRLFCPGPVHFIAAQKRLYSNQNRAIQRTKWFKVGTTMKSGGAHKLTCELECSDGEFVIEYDVPRCDKNFKLMKWIYRTRNKFLELTDPFDIKAAQWVQDNITYTLTILWDGTVIATATHNPSGQNNTADDTCPWTASHILTLARKACPEVTRAELKALVLHIYSDDFRGKFPRKFAKMRDPHWVKQVLYDVFQVVIKLEDWKVFDGPDGTHFLGADTVLWNGIYWCHYNPERLRAAFKFTEGTLTVGQELFRLGQLLIHAYPYPEMYAEFRKIYAALLLRYRDSTDAEVRVLTGRGLPSERQLHGVHTGLEGFHGAILTFCAPTDGGGVKSFQMDGKAKSKQRNSKSAPNGGGQQAPVELAGLQGRVRKLNKLVGQHAALSGNAAPPRASRSEGSGGSGNGGNGAGGPPRGVSKPVPPVTKAPAPKATPAKARTGAIVGKTHKMFVDIIRKETGKNIGRIPHTYGNAALPRASAKELSQINGVSASRTMRFGGMRSHEYVNGKGQHLQFQCQQWLGTIDTNVKYLTRQPNRGPGERLFHKMLSPGAFGGALYQASRNWQNVSFKHVTITYTSCAASTDRGSIYLQYVADPLMPAVDTGTDEVSHATTNGQMVTTSVYNENPVSLVVQPEKVVKELALNDPDPSRFSFGGNLYVGVLDTILSNLVLGDVIVTYDVEFSNPILSYSVSDEQELEIAIQFNVAANTLGRTALEFTFGGDMGWPPPAGANGILNGTPPEDGVNYLVAMRFIGYDNSGAGTLFWHTVSDPTVRPLEPGCVLYGALSSNAVNGAVVWDDGTVQMDLYAVALKDGTFAQMGDWELVFGQSTTLQQGTAYFAANFIPGAALE